MPRVFDHDYDCGCDYDHFVLRTCQVRVGKSWRRIGQKHVNTLNMRKNKTWTVMGYSFSSSGHHDAVDYHTVTDNAAVGEHLGHLPLSIPAVHSLLSLWHR